jgi:hypothetical protein
MDKRYFIKLIDDLITQFKEQPNTSALAEAIAEQLQDVYVFFEQLRTLRTLTEAAGKQLDGIGDIVAMSRTEAVSLAGLTDTAALTDELYRQYLKYKIFLNTSSGTYHDVLNGLRMFVPDIALYYSEDPAHPATMYFDTSDLSPAELEEIFAAPIARAAGVQVVIRAQTRTPLERSIYIYRMSQYRWTRRVVPHHS